jgi:hypothetical protein
MASANEKYSVRYSPYSKSSSVSMKPNGNEKDKSPNATNMEVSASQSLNLRMPAMLVRSCYQLNSSGGKVLYVGYETENFVPVVQMSKAWKVISQGCMFTKSGWTELTTTHAKFVEDYFNEPNCKVLLIEIENGKYVIEGLEMFNAKCIAIKNTTNVDNMLYMKKTKWDGIMNVKQCVDMNLVLHEKDMSTLKTIYYSTVRAVHSKMSDDNEDESERSDPKKLRKCIKSLTYDDVCREGNWYCPTDDHEETQKVWVEEIKSILTCKVIQEVTNDVGHFF